MASSSAITPTATGSTTTASTDTMYFGIEIELLLTPTNVAGYSDWEAAANVLRDVIRGKGVLIEHDRSYSRRANTNFRTWLIIEETKVGGAKSDSDGSEADMLFGDFEDEDLQKKKRDKKKSFVFEFISKKYNISELQSGDFNCQTDLDKIFASIKNHFQISYCEGLGTHVHVSSPSWNLAHYQKIAKAILRCEGAIDAAMPQHRIGNFYCESNYTNTSLGKMSLDQAVDTVNSTTSLDDLIDTMCPKGERNFKWNFQNLKNENRRTIEFRQPPACSSADDAHNWILRTVKFLYYAASDSDTETLKGIWSK